MADRIYGLKTRTIFEECRLQACIMLNITGWLFLYAEYLNKDDYAFTIAFLVYLGYQACVFMKFISSSKTRISLSLKDVRWFVTNLSSSIFCFLLFFCTYSIKDIWGCHYSIQCYSYVVILQIAFSIYNALV